MNVRQRGQLADHLLPMLRRGCGWPLWGVSHSRRTGDLTLAASPDPHPHPRRWCVVVSCPRRTWAIFQDGKAIAQGPDPGDQHQVYEGRGWLRLMGENILAAWPSRGASIDPDSPEAIKARYAEQGAHNLAVHEREARLTAAASEPLPQGTRFRHRGPDGCVSDIEALSSGFLQQDYRYRRAGGQWAESRRFHGDLRTWYEERESPDRQQGTHGLAVHERAKGPLNVRRTVMLTKADAETLDAECKRTGEPVTVVLRRWLRAGLDAAKASA